MLTLSIIFNAALAFACWRLKGTRSMHEAFTAVIKGGGGPGPRPEPDPDDGP